MIQSNKVKVTLDGDEIGGIIKLEIKISRNQMLPEAELVTVNQECVWHVDKKTKTTQCFVKSLNDNQIELLTSLED